MNNRVFIGLLTVLLLPLFFVNVRDSHDWGDDFAQYLLQAENMVESKSQLETGYLYDTRFPVVAPPAYPAGFPLLLAPVYASYGHSIWHYDLLITLFLVLFCLLMGAYFRQEFSAAASALLVIAFAWNEWTLDFKTNILSDIPFAFFLLACTMAYTTLQGRRGVVVTGLLAGCLLLLRGAGIVFLAAALVHSSYRWIRNKDKHPIIAAILLVAIALACSFLINRLFHIPSSGFFGFYGDAFAGGKILEAAGSNLYYYMEVFKAFFEPRMDEWKFIAKGLAWIAFLLLIIGVAYSLRRKRSFMDVLTGCYLLLILLYPYGAGGFRFLLPIVPFLFIYMATRPAVADCRSLAGEGNAGCLLAALIIAYEPALEEVLKHRKDIPEGPQRKESAEMLDHLRSQVKPGEVVMFIKPKALALYARVKTCSTVHTQSAADVKAVCANLGVNFLLQTGDAADKPMEQFIASYPQNVALQWENSRFRLYKVKL
jgi:hypothetical protein